jgi:TatD DNase family protein
MDIIDTHCHLDVDAFDTDRQAVLTRAQANGVKHIVIPGIHSGNWQTLLSLCGQYTGLHPAFGLHPVYSAQHKDADIPLLQDAIRQHRPVAVGEIGLDFYIDSPDKPRQLALLEQQLEIAIETNLPVILHVRKAHEQMLALLKSHPVRSGIAHAFNGSLQQAAKYIEYGFKLGFGGMLTYERSTKLRKLARDLPLESLVLETDAPDMTVASHHGERNSPEYLPECLQALAAVRGEDSGRVAAQTSQNAMDVLQLHK